MPPPNLTSPRLRTMPFECNGNSLENLNLGVVEIKEESNEGVLSKPVDMNQMSTYLSSCSFSKRQHTQKWTPEETRKFYKVYFFYKKYQIKKYMKK